MSATSSGPDRAKTPTKAAPARGSAVGRTRLRVPRSIDQVLKLTRYQLREYFSSRRFVILLGIILAIGVILTVVVAHFQSSMKSCTPTPGLLCSGVDFWQGAWGGAAGFVIVLAAVFFGGDAIAGEFQNKTGYFLMGLPIRRATVYVGKYIAALAASISVLLLFLVVLLANAAAYFGGGALVWALLPSLGLALVYLMAVLGTTFLFSSLFKTSAYGFVLTAILFLFGFSILETVVSGLVKMEPWMVISYASGSIGGVFSDPVNWGLVGTVTQTRIGPRAADVITTYTCGVAEGAVIMIAYFVLTAIAGLLLFEREEFA